jgi:signal transduction histidine kinase
MEASDLLRILSDPKRLEILAATALLHTPPEQVFDRLTQLAGKILNAPVSLVSLVGKDYQFFKSQTGLPEPWATERLTALSHSFCQHVVAAAAPLIVADARQHPLLKDNEAIRDLKVIAYLGIPLTTSEGQTLGSFCTIDSQPRSWTTREIEIMQELASFVMNEIELRLLARHFQANYLELRDVELERDELVQMLVHDLRSPLSSLLSGLDLLDALEGSPTGQELLKTARKGAQSLLRIVGDVLDISKSQARRLHLELGEVLPGEVVEVAVAMVARKALEEGITIEKDVPAEVPSFIGDREILRRVLVNLVGNAIHHTPRHGKISVSVHYHAETKRIIFKVSDAGTSLSKEEFGPLAETFTRARVQTTGRLAAGSGLSFCKMAAKAHAGDISIESEPGGGTTFQLEIPTLPPLQNGTKTPA